MAHDRDTGGGRDPNAPASAQPSRDDTVLVRPDRGSAARWTAAAVLLPAAVGWVVADTGGALWAWIVLGVCVAVTLYFAMQLAMPGLFEVELGAQRLRIHQPWLRAEISWRAIADARIERSLGDPVLVVDVRPTSAGAAGRTVRTLLPLGAEPGAIEQVLAQRLDDARGTVGT